MTGLGSLLHPYARKALQSRPTSGSSKIPVQGDKFFELLNNFSINHELGISRMWLPGTDTTFITTNNVNMTGTMQLTPNWGVRVGNIGYDFISKKLTYPDIGLVRNLHCWELAFNFQPTRGTYTFHIGVSFAAQKYFCLPGGKPVCV